MRCFAWNGFAIYHFSPKQKHSDQKILFSHANGISAFTYRTLLQEWADLWGVEIFSYDMRGMGRSDLSSKEAYTEGKRMLWKHLARDLSVIFDMLTKEFPSKEPWILSGHSLGGWLSLIAARRCGVENLVLLDIPMLPPAQAIKWTLACAVGLRRIHPLGKVARRRKRKFNSLDQAKKAFRRNPFFKRWSETLLDDFVDGNYEERNRGAYLRHTPEWEADVFENMPVMAAQLILKIPKSVRDKLRIDFFVGGKSNVCDPQSENYFKGFFPKTQWKVCADGEHMFPFEKKEQFFLLLRSIRDVHVNAEEELPLSA